MKPQKKVGLIVNPIAGMGGRVGLKGTDGHEILIRARELGARSDSPKRAIDALRRMAHIKNYLEMITCPSEMGEDEAHKCGFNPTVIGTIKIGFTTAHDTKTAAKEMLKLKADLLVFAGGDGTARDIYNAIGKKIPVLGIPTGVKIHSAVFGTSPQNAGDLASMYLEESSGIRLHEAEVMDVDEHAFRKNRLSAKLYGYLLVPYERGMTQSAKAGSSLSEKPSMESIAYDVINNMAKDTLYIIGPGTTAKAVMEKLGLKSNLLGIDVICNKKLVGSDLNEVNLLKTIGNKKTKIIVSIIGRQGYIFGRGNQQISAKIIKKVGRENIIVLATKNKIFGLNAKTLLVDTGDDKVNNMLAGYIKVVSGLGERIVLKISY